MTRPQESGARLAAAKLAFDAERQTIVATLRAELGIPVFSLKAIHTSAQLAIRGVDKGDASKVE